MKKLEPHERKHITNLFRGIEDSMVIAYIQGYMGSGWADRIPDPTLGLINSGEYTFLAGDCESAEAKELAGNIFAYIDGDETTVIYDDNEPGWGSLISSARELNPKIKPRFRIAQKDYDFDEDLLQSYTESLPAGFEMKPFDKDLYQKAMSESWSKEFCETFDSDEDYLNRGFGFGILRNGKLVSGASTMTVYDGGTETQVATAAEFRNKGLALSCAAAFILECKRRKIRPCWDAANAASLHMAIKLGYEYTGGYTTFLIHRQKKDGGNTSHI